MNELLQFIFDNPFLLFLIVMGIFSAYNRYLEEQKKKVEKRTRKTDQPKVELTLPEEVRKEDPLVEKLEEVKEIRLPKAEQVTELVEEVKKTVLETQSTTENKVEETAEELQRLEEKYARLRQAEERMKRLQEEERKRKQEQKSLQAQSQTIDLRSRLNQEGLVESVIMAEILGPPKARRKKNYPFL